jgi:hypothetical protein
MAAIFKPDDLGSKGKFEIDGRLEYVELNRIDYQTGTKMSLKNNLNNEYSYRLYCEVRTLNRTLFWGKNGIIVE